MTVKPTVRPTPVQMQRQATAQRPILASPHQRPLEECSEDYQWTVHTAATAIANEIAIDNGFTASPEVLQNVDEKTRYTAIRFAVKVVDAVAAWGMQQALKKQAPGVAKTIEQQLMESAAHTSDDVVCQTCKAYVAKAEKNDLTKVIFVQFDCGAEVLITEKGTKERRTCPKPEGQGKSNA